jgi:hypothetical protein
MEMSLLDPATLEIPGQHGKGASVTEQDWSRHSYPV